MRILYLFGALAILSIAGALFFQAARLRARHLRFASEPVPALDVSALRLIDAPRALWHGTRFADGAALLIPALREPCVGDLFLTEEALFFQREAEGALLQLPLRWVSEASLHRAHAALAGKELPMLRLRWRRGGEEVLSDLSLRGGMASLETLRRELHLRTARVA